MDQVPEVLPILADLSVVLVDAAAFVPDKDRAKPRVNELKLLLHVHFGYAIWLFEVVYLLFDQLLKTGDWSHIFRFGFLGLFDSWHLLVGLCLS